MERKGKESGSEHDVHDNRSPCGADEAIDGNEGEIENKGEEGSTEKCCRKYFPRMAVEEDVEGIENDAIEEQGD